MVRQLGLADRQAMHTERDVIASTFIPNHFCRAEQMARAIVLMAAGCRPEEVASLLSIPISELEA